MRHVLPRAAWHPIGFAIAYVLNAFVATSVSPYAAVRALIVAVVAAAVLVLIGRLLLGSAQRGGLLATAIVAFVILGRELAVIIGNFVRLTPGPLVLLMAVLLLAIVVLSVRLVRRRSGSSSASAWTERLNLAAIVLLIVVTIGAISRGTIPQAISDLRQGVPLPAEGVHGTGSGPDIYLILLDGYPRADVLRNRFGMDDSHFLGQLRSRGFVVANASHSNYMLTQLTLTSMFNMALLQDVPSLKAAMAGKAPEQPTGRNALNDNRSFAFLRSQGYAVAAFAAPYEDVSLRQADVYVDAPQLTEFEWQLVASTFVLDALQWLSPDLFPSQQRARIDDAFVHAAQVAADRDLRARFLFAHVLAPHTPFVYGAHGEPLDVPVLRRTEDTAAGMGLTDEQFAARLRGQVDYVNGRTLGLIDSILAASPKPPVIIVMSDHGSRSRPLEPATATPADLAERFGSLFAAYTPGRQDVFPDDVTPAQVMGLLFHAYFGSTYIDPGMGTYLSDASAPLQVVQVPEPPPPS